MDPIWTVVVLALLAAWAALGVLNLHLRQRHRLRLREIIHRERMAALEKSVPLPELDPALDDAFLESMGVSPADRALQKARIGALAAGLVLILGGIGFVIAFLLIPETPQTLGMREEASLGLIPFFLGLALLLFHRLSRPAADRDHPVDT